MFDHISKFGFKNHHVNVIYDIKKLFIVCLIKLLACEYVVSTNIFQMVFKLSYVHWIPIVLHGCQLNF